MTSPLAKAAGPVALVSGVVFAAVDVARLLAADRSRDRIDMMRQTPFIVTNALYWVAFVGLVLAMVSPGAILAGGSGMLAPGGLSSYVLFAIGWMVFGIAAGVRTCFPRGLACCSLWQVSLTTTPGYRTTGSPPGTGSRQRKMPWA
jgi:hypothetical protein